MMQLQPSSLPVALVREAGDHRLWLQVLPEAIRDDTTECSQEEEGDYRVHELLRPDEREHSVGHHGNRKHTIPAFAQGLVLEERRVLT